MDDSKEKDANRDAEDVLQHPGPTRVPEWDPHSRSGPCCRRSHEVPGCYDPEAAREEDSAGGEGGAAEGGGHGGEEGREGLPPEERKHDDEDEHEDAADEEEQDHERRGGRGEEGDGVEGCQGLRLDCGLLGGCLLPRG